MVRDEVTREVLQVLNSGVIPGEWNETAIVLIPKVESPELVSQFRPISLCNVIYKVVSKVLSRRLKAILPEVISNTHSAFVPRRLITDNVLVAYESFHTIKNKRQGNRGICAVKLDMHKDYDRVEWNFLHDMMIRLGFDQIWVNLIMSCVTSVNNRVRFNADETETFTPTRGIRQGGSDVAIPFFVMC
jgi:hypothetical protein